MLYSKVEAAYWDTRRRGRHGAGSVLAYLEEVIVREGEREGEGCVWGRGDGGVREAGLGSVPVDAINQ